MARITVTDDSVQLRFSMVEKILGLVRDQDFPRSAVASTRVEQQGLHAAKGMRAPGLGLPGIRLVGTWRGKGRSLISVRRDEPAVVVELTGQRYERLVIGAEDAAEVAASLAAPA